MLERVSSRQRLRIPAGDWNAAMDAARDLMERRTRGLAESDFVRVQSSPTVVAVRNDSGIDVDRFGVLGLGDPVVLDDENLSEFQNRILLSGELPDATHTDRFGIVQDWLPHVDGDDQAIGSAVILGVAIVRVETTTDSPSFATPKPGATDRLIAAGSGAQILYAGPRDDDDLAWCIVRIGGGGGSASATFAMISAKTGTEPPFRYSAEGATMDEDGEWSGGGTEYDGIFNIEEQGSGGQWVNPLLVGDVVMLWPAPGGAAAWVCSRSHYRGTY